jgi:hypothetical protein
MIYDWEGTDEHKAVITDAWKAQGDVHTAVAEKYGVDRQEAKLANWRLSYGSKPPAPANDVTPFATLTTVSVCLLSDMHQCLHRGERCPECGYCFEEIG